MKEKTFQFNTQAANSYKAIGTITKNAEPNIIINISLITNLISFSHKLNSIHKFLKDLGKF